MSQFEWSSAISMMSGRIIRRVRVHSLRSLIPKMFALGYRHAVGVPDVVLMNGRGLVRPEPVDVEFLESAAALLVNSLRTTSSW